MNENETSLMNKNVNDLTVGDALKINAAVLGACVAVPAVLIGCSVVKEKIHNFRVRRAAKTLDLTIAEK